ncbi:uncharacterized protein LOC125229841 [Leguminivora glycinivorella]|uniref:uncharacterized protein LOC125229841 n=1 Tax=Leguminivora glycinivorella TaxID=1035111 RepID=UPI00200D2609|nr:uncharacterized protein LOC125229841 [Leguminivora glycinivorella]
MAETTNNDKTDFPSENNITAVDIQNEGYVVFEDALVLVSENTTKYRVLILSVYSLIAAIAEVFSGGIIVAASQCDLGLGVIEKGIIGSVPVLGVIISAHFWGYLTDTRGRLYTLHITILGTAAFAFLCRPRIAYPTL